ncbi:MAG: MFS transporter, partial [Gemmataceae bacterium]|nr:MFS transporter [Gemmataceae bacterium]
SAAVAVGGRLGGAVAPVLTVWLAGLAAAGWRLPFWVYGGVGMAGAVVFYGWFRNRPADHPAVNPAEVALIGGADPRPDGPVGPPPLAGMATSRALWLASVVQFLANFAWAFIITLFPKYLAQVFETPERERAWYQAYPLYAGIVGMLLGGWLTDRAVRRYGLRWGRAVPVAASRLVVGAAYLACLGAADPVAVMLLMCVVAWATDVGTAPVWAYAQDVGGRHVGAVIGWANMWGNLGAWLAPMVLSRVARDAYPGDPAAGWDAAFLLCAATQLVAAAAALGIDARRPVRGA